MMKIIDTQGHVPTLCAACFASLPPSAYPYQREDLSSTLGTSASKIYFWGTDTRLEYSAWDGPVQCSL